MNKLNILVRTFARAINEGRDVTGSQIPDMIGHMYGFDKYCLETNQPSGLLLFTRIDGNSHFDVNDFGWETLPNGQTVIDYSLLNCLNIGINPDIIADPYLLACNSSATIGESNNDVIHGFARLEHYPSLFKEGKLIDFIIGTSDHLAIDRMQARNFEFSYYEITMATDNQRMSISGVDINEEMMAMVKYNQLYLACSRMVNTINNIYDIMINRLGAF